MCVYMCVCCACTCVDIYVEARGQAPRRLSSGTVYLVCWDRLSHWLPGAADWIRLSGQGAPGICLSLLAPSPCTGIANMYLCACLFSVSSEAQTQVPELAGLGSLSRARTSLSMLHGGESSLPLPVPRLVSMTCLSIYFPWHDLYPMQMEPSLTHPENRNLDQHLPFLPHRSTATCSWKGICLRFSSCWLPFSLWSGFSVQSCSPR